MRWFSMCLMILFATAYGVNVFAGSNNKKTIKALYMPLADHYAALVAYERYRDKMKHADLQLEQMKSWDLLRAYFQSGEVDMAYVMTPLALSMFQEKPHFRWIGLMHRDGSALAINEILNHDVGLAEVRSARVPDAKVAEALLKAKKTTGRQTQVGVPHVLSTHSVILYRYLKNHGLKLAFNSNQPGEVLAIPVSPAKSPAFIRGKTNRARPGAFEQSLPWADVVDTEGYGHLAWYSKDVMPWPNGHVECITLATDQAIEDKYLAVKEVMYFIQQAGADIEWARKQGGKALEEIVQMVRKHIPAHGKQAIIASLSAELGVINYNHLNIDKAGLTQIMDYAVQGGILEQPVQVDSFADERFVVTERESSAVVNR